MFIGFFFLLFCFLFFFFFFFFFFFSSLALCVEKKRSQKKSNSILSCIPLLLKLERILEKKAISNHLTHSLAPGVRKGLFEDSKRHDQITARFALFSLPPPSTHFCLCIFRSPLPLAFIFSIFDFLPFSNPGPGVGGSTPSLTSQLPTRIPSCGGKKNTREEDEVWPAIKEKSKIGGGGSETSLVPC